MFNEILKYYQFNEKQGYKGTIDILTDKIVASAAESAYTLFYHHPKVRYIGENTRGAQQYQQGCVNLPCGYGMRLGLTKLTYWDKAVENIECDGHKTDIKCKTGEALNVALTNTHKPVQHELNEPPKVKIPAPDQDSYKPTDPESRGAYSAQYIVRALKRVEEEAKKSPNLAARLAIFKKKRIRPLSQWDARILRMLH